MKTQMNGLYVGILLVTFLTSNSLAQSILENDYTPSGYKRFLETKYPDKTITSDSVLREAVALDLAPYIEKTIHNSGGWRATNLTRDKITALQHILYSYVGGKSSLTEFEKNPARVWKDSGFDDVSLTHLNTADGNKLARWAFFQGQFGEVDRLEFMRHEAELWRSKGQEKVAALVEKFPEVHASKTIFEWNSRQIEPENHRPSNSKSGLDELDYISHTIRSNMHQLFDEGGPRSNSFDAVIAQLSLRSLIRSKKFEINTRITDRVRAEYRTSTKTKMLAAIKLLEPKTISASAMRDLVHFQITRDEIEKAMNRRLSALESAAYTEFTKAPRNHQEAEDKIRGTQVSRPELTDTDHEPAPRASDGESIRLNGPQ